MKMHKKAAESEGYVLVYNKSLKVYSLIKEGFNVVNLSKTELEMMPIWKLISILKTNDQQV